MGTTNVLVMKLSRFIDACKNMLHYKERTMREAAQKKRLIPIQFTVLKTPFI